MEGIFSGWCDYSIHPDQFHENCPMKNSDQEPQGVDIKRLAHACVRMKGFATGPQWIFVDPFSRLETEIQKIICR